MSDPKTGQMTQSEMEDFRMVRMFIDDLETITVERWALARKNSELQREIAEWKNIAERAVEWCFRRWQPGGEFENEWMPFGLRELKHDYEKALGYE